MNNQEKITSSEITNNPESRSLSSTPMEQIQQLREKAKSIIAERNKIQTEAREGTANAREVLDKVKAMEEELDELMAKELAISDAQNKKYTVETPAPEGPRGEGELFDNALKSTGEYAEADRLDARRRTAEGKDAWEEGRGFDKTADHRSLRG